jgi:catechol 2,3-dioxygenase-like lactoylglutathione lyase family enzyme
MTNPVLNYILLAVKDPLASAEFYNAILGAKPVQSASTFVLYALPTGLKVGLWATADIKPTPQPAGAVELSFSLPDQAAVLDTYEAWTKLGLKVVQEPTRMDFGFTFVVADPDGHRLRPFARNDNQV